MKYDVAIIGAGPAGMTAGIFASRAGLRTICFEQMGVGGNMALAHMVDNYPGIPSITGIDLSGKMLSHAEKLGVEFKYEKITTLKKDKSGFTLTSKHNTYEAKKVILACGCRTKKLDIDNVNDYLGKGISYCASCDANFYKDKVVAVVGGGYSALGDAMYLSNLAKKVYLIHRRDSFRFPAVKLKALQDRGNIELVTCATVTALEGKSRLESVELSVGGKAKHLDLDALFIAIGQEPDIDLVGLDVDLDPGGYIKVKKDQSTSVRNLYACGDVTNNKLKQIITACADGAVAASSCIGG